MVGVCFYVATGSAKMDAVGKFSLSVTASGKQTRNKQVMRYTYRNLVQIIAGGHDVWGASGGMAGLAPQRTLTLPRI